MKIEEIIIVVAEQKPVTLRTQAYVMEYNMDQENYPVYSISDPIPTYRSRYNGPTLSITFMCPKCATEFKTTIREWSYSSVEMVCTCGLPLHVLPDRGRRERYEFADTGHYPINPQDL